MEQAPFGSVQASFSGSFFLEGTLGLRFVVHSFVPRQTVQQSDISDPTPCHDLSLFGNRIPQATSDPEVAT